MKQAPRPASPILNRLRVAALGASRGSVTIEMVFVIPMLIVVMLACFVYYDAFRNQRTNIAAAFTISDLVSRQVTPVTPAMINGMHDVYDYITRSRFPTSLRVSSIYYNVINRRYEVVWSHATRGGTPLTTAALQSRLERLPMIARGDTAIVVESAVDYVPPFNVGFGRQELRYLVVTRPRFAPQVIFDTGVGGPVALTPCQQNLVSCGW